jgi:Ca2+-binding RTX toxin-like protein
MAALTISGSEKAIAVWLYMMRFSNAGLNMTDVGINLAAVNYYTYQEPFLDRFKTTPGWVTYGGTKTSVPVDVNGNPTYIPAGVTGITAMVGVDPIDSGKTNVYDLYYSGSGTLTVGAGATAITSAPGHITFTVSQSRFQVYVTQDSSANPLRDFHVIRHDQLDSYNSGEIFNPDFLDKVQNWQTLRFMDWGATNSSTISSWSERSTPDSVSWASNNAVPIEVMVKLANEAHVDMWYNVPTQADDGYVKKAIQYIHDNLDPSLKVSIEYSNEVWNFAFPQAQYAQTKANALWAKDSNGNGTIDSSESISGGNEVYYGYRSAQIAAIAHDIFGADAGSRLKDVLSGQTVNVGLTNYMLKGIGLAGKGSISDLFSEYAVTTYFGWQMGSASTADQAKIYSWATSGASGMDAAFKELEHGGQLSNNYSLDGVMKYFIADAAFAKANGLSLVAYEGAADLEYRLFPVDQQPTIKAFFAALTNDPRMGPLYTKMLDEFSAAGGVSANIHTDVGFSSPFGYFGVLDSIYQKSSPRYDALVSYAGKNNVVSTQPAQTPVAAHVLWATSGDDHLVGGDGNDQIFGSSNSVDGAGHLIESDYYSGAAGSDTITGGDGNDHIYGNTASTVSGSPDGADSLSGGKGNDYIQGNAGDDVIDGGAGNDRLYGGSGNDSMLGGDGQDVMQGNRGADTLIGGDGNDVEHGGADDDLLQGGSGNDTLTGDLGNDTLGGGSGHDLLVGGDGSDTFIFSGGDAKYDSSGTDAYRGDEIADFSVHNDHISFAFSVTSLLVSAGVAVNLADAAVLAQHLVDQHVGSGEVAAIAVGGDTYLFYDSAGGDIVNSVVKLDHVAPDSLTADLFV